MMLLLLAHDDLWAIGSEPCFGNGVDIDPWRDPRISIRTSFTGGVRGAVGEGCV
jgi:hypothetical protein